MSNLLKNLKPKARVAKNGFDLSRKHVYSSRPGLIETPLFLECVPGDYHEINMAALTRTQTFLKPAFLRGKFRYDFFFVPYVQLWHPFNQFVSQRDDKHSSLQLSHNYCPVIDLGELLEMYCEDAVEGGSLYQEATDIYGMSGLDHLVRCLDLMGYGNHFVLLNLVKDQAEEDIAAYCAKFKQHYVNVFRAAAFQHIWYDWYRNKYFDTTPFQDLYQGSDYVSFFNWDDIECDTFAHSIIPLTTPSNKQRVFGLFSARYAPWKKDLFTGSLPGQQFGAVSTVLIGSGSGQTGPAVFEDTETSWKNTGNTVTGDVYGLYVRNAGFTLGRDGSSVSSSRSTLGSRLENPHVHSLSAGSSAFDVLTLRKAEMLQNWKQATLRAGNMTDDQFEAHFGVKPYYDADENVDFLGSYEAVLNVNPVTANAETGESLNGALADMAATGVAVANGNKITFESRDFGVIVCCAYFVPEIEYNSTMIDKANRLSEQFDFFTPEFQNIGLEAIQFVDYDAQVKPSTFSRVLGYAPRYWHYKTAVDKVFGQFSKYSAYIRDEDSENYEGALLAWVAPRHEIYGSTIHSDQDNVYRAISSFYVDPGSLDQNFGVSVSDNIETDTFVNNVYFDIKSIRPMSVLGLPQF